MVFISPSCISSLVRRSVKDLIRKYDLELTASTFLILDSDPTSLEIACEWQRCMGGQVTIVIVHVLILTIYSLFVILILILISAEGPLSLR